MDLSRRSPLVALSALTVVALAACGGGGGGGNSPTYMASPPAQAGAGTGPPAVSTGAPASDARAPAAPTVAAAPPAPVAPAPAAAPPVPSMAVAAAQTFPLVAVGDTSAHGTVTVTPEGAQAVVAVTAAGLPPMTSHSVHLHFGQCPSAGTHILVLGTLFAGANGAGSISATVNSVFTGAGHFVIIYVGPTAGPLGACANLG